MYEKESGLLYSPGLRGSQALQGASRWQTHSAGYLASTTIGDSLQVSGRNSIFGGQSVTTRPSVYCLAGTSGGSGRCRCPRGGRGGYRSHWRCWVVCRHSPNRKVSELRAADICHVLELVHEVVRMILVR